MLSDQQFGALLDRIERIVRDVVVPAAVAEAKRHAESVVMDMVRYELARRGDR